MQIAEPHYSRLKDEIIKLLRLCEDGFKQSRDDRDYSVYTGTGGMEFVLHTTKL